MSCTQSDRLFTDYVDAVRPIVKAALKINEQMAVGLSACSEENRYQYAVRYNGAHHDPIFDMFSWREKEAAHHEEASRIVVEGTKRIFDKGTHRGFKLQMFIDDGKVCFNHVSIVHLHCISSRITPAVCNVLGPRVRGETSV